MSFDRRLFVLGLAALPLARASAFAAPKGGFVMWRDPGCGCCLAWADRMTAAFGANMAVVQVPDMHVVKRAQGVPEGLHACHTALVGGYAIEGHVPPADIKRLIASGSTSVRGLAVPGMPAGSPGMDIGHSRRDPYQVIAFDRAGRRAVFARYGQARKTSRTVPPG